MSWTVTRRPDVLTAQGVQQVCEIEFAGPVDRLESITALKHGQGVTIGIVTHPAPAALPAAASIDLSTKAVRHFIGLLEKIASEQEANGA